MAARGLILNTARHAAALFPDLFQSRDAATRAVTRALAGRRLTDLECVERLSSRVRYQVAGAGHPLAEAFVAPDRLAGLRGDLEAALGRLVLFDVGSSEAAESAARLDAPVVAKNAKPGCGSANDPDLKAAVVDGH